MLESRLIKKLNMCCLVSGESKFAGNTKNMSSPPPRVVSVFEQIDDQHIYVCASSSATVSGVCLLALCRPITLHRGCCGRQGPPAARVATRTTSASLAENETEIKSSSQEAASPSLYFRGVYFLYPSAAKLS